MSLAQFIQVNTSYTRSINLERDSESQGSPRPYLLTSRAMQTLARIADTLQPIETPRAWALVGPYGSGKSAFGLFLSRLLGRGDGEAARLARAALEQSAPELAATYRRHLGEGPGYCVAVLTGSPESLAGRLSRALHAAAKGYFAGGRAPRVVSRLAEAAEQAAEISAIVALVGELQEAIQQAGGAGLLIVIDELGKFLEHEARHRGATEIYLLQALAEHALQPKAAPLQLVVLLHQSFEQYAQTLGEQLRNEWKKVQGRFESVPFLETTEQTLRVIKAALVQDFDAATRSWIEAEAARMAGVLADQYALPPALGREEAAALFAGCYPLHPVALLLLPTLCQRVAQNERTLFSYLGSHEPHGFLDALGRLDGHGWIKPWEIYEYFILNQPGLVTDHLTHRRWAEIVTALERLGDAPEAMTRMLKTVGLMNIVGAQGGLKPSPEVLALCAEDGEAAGPWLDALAERSLITFRRFNGEYRVWQGSDFDLEAALAEQLSQIGQMDIADVLNQAKPLAPVIARRHAIERGTLRYFLPEFVGGQGVGRIRVADQPTLFI